VVLLELSERSEDMEDQLPPTGTGVQLFLLAFEVDATALQVLDGVDEMPERAAKTVQSPHDKGVPRTQMRERVGEPWTVCAGA
jgi:hypothetical protein